MGSQQTFMGFEVKYTNIGTVRQTRVHSVNAQVSAADGISMMRLHNDLAIEVLDYGTKEVIGKL